MFVPGANAEPPTKIYFSYRSKSDPQGSATALPAGRWFNLWFGSKITILVEAGGVNDSVAPSDGRWDSVVTSLTAAATFGAPVRVQMIGDRVTIIGIEWTKGC